MNDDPGTGTDTQVCGDEEEVTPTAPPGKMGLGFYASLGLIVLLVLMVIVLNYPAAKANAGLMMSGTNWTLQSLMDSTGVLIPAQSGTAVTALFDREGRMSGNAGCNGYSASYQTRDYSINITGISQTKMFCHGPGVMEQESAYLTDLAKVSSFRVSESTLKFYDAAGKNVLTFVPV